MSVAFASLSILMSLVLVWSGAAKIRDPQSLVAAMGQLRVPATFAGKSTRRLVPWIELVLASLLVFAHGVLSVLGWTATLVLFVVYLTLIVRASRQSEPASCNCFGASSARVTNWTVARNILLATGAAAGWTGALVGGLSEQAAPAWLGAQAWIAISIVGLAAATAFVLGVEYGRSTLVGTRDAVAAGTANPLQSDTELNKAPVDLETRGVAAEYTRGPIPVAVVELDNGTQQLLTGLSRERAVVLFYLSATCSPCLEVGAQLPQWTEQLVALDLVVVAYNQYEVDLLKTRIQQRAVTDVAGSVQKALSMDAVPSAVILGADGLLAGGPVTGTEDIKQMMEELCSQFPTLERDHVARRDSSA